MPFEIVRNDITNMRVDAIVNAASHLPRVQAGVDSAIHEKAGPALLAAREKIGSLPPGTAAVTPAFGLDAKFVIHAATPTWVDGNHNEEPLLRQAYEMCLALAARHRCESIAFPLLAAGNHGFPKALALQIAIRAFSAFLMEQDMQIYLVCSVRSYIDENYVAAFEAKTYSGSNLRYQSSAREMPPDLCAMPCAPAPKEKASAKLSLKDFLMKKDDGFTQRLLTLIQEKGMKNSTVYKKANISKQHFSKILNDPNAKPSKQTAIALALALELDLEETRDLIGRAGYALTNSSTFDLIIRYFIERKEYNVIEINIALYEFDQSLLGS